MIREGNFSKTIVVILGAVMVMAYGTVEATVINGDFSGGLADWEAHGTVSSVGGVAILGDDFPGADLYQGIAAGPGNFVLEFDFLGMLSSDLSADPFAFPDTFFASILFIDDYSQFDLALGIFDDSLSLFDMDDLGVFNANPSATIGTSALGGDWQHFRMAFNSAYTYVVPTFELWDFNYVIGDSEVQIDNVSLTASQAPIPEPATLVLFSLGVLGVTLQKKRSIDICFDRFRA